jgi:hypothetical protein
LNVTTVVYSVPNSEPFLQNVCTDVANNWRQRTAHSHATFLYEEFLIHQEVEGAEKTTPLPQFF